MNMKLLDIVTPPSIYQKVRRYAACLIYPNEYLAFLPGAKLLEKLEWMN